METSCERFEVDHQKRAELYSGIERQADRLFDHGSQCIFEALIKIKGRLVPLSAFSRCLRYMKRIQFVRTLVLGVLKDYRNRGYELALIQKTIHEGLSLGFHASDCSLVVETNTRLIEGLDAIGAKKYKTFRLYKKEI